ncbi:hypothetical protein SDC9_193769 [bioreactor metagenome]|uniref:Uncharacterized protein n=1 Tax=bioreactor metagenome TaxID=1076179 RepID=A0A645I5L8_9ZZZZ
MDCSTLVDLLLANGSLTALPPADPTGHKAVYQILSPQAELFPRLAVFETAREYTAWADDTPILERTAFRVDIYARENVLRGVNAALHRCLSGNGFRRLAQVADDYLPDEAIYVKSVNYEHYESLMEG